MLSVDAKNQQLAKNRSTPDDEQAVLKQSKRAFDLRFPKDSQYEDVEFTATSLAKIAETLGDLIFRQASADTGTSET